MTCIIKATPAQEDALPVPVLASQLQPALACLPALDALSERVARVHGPSQPHLLVLRECYLSLALALDDLSQRRDEAAASLAAARLLRQLRVLSQGYAPPAGACRSYRSLYAGLAELDLELTPHLQRLAGLEALDRPAPGPGWREAAACRHA